MIDKIFKNLKFTLLSFVCLLITLSSAHAKIFDAQSFTLENGLQVVVVTNERAPVVTHMVWYKVGAADEPQGLSGMAHYFEHLMFKGTETLKPGEFSRIVKQLGGNDNAFTGQDYTAYFQSIAVQHLERMMRMEADRMMNLRVLPEDFKSEKSVVLEERRQRTDNNPKAIFSEQMRSALFINHPYGTPIIGWMNEIEGYEWDDVKVFYDTWYAPNNSIVIISGDITLDEVKPMAGRTYGKLKPKDLPVRKRTEIPPANGVGLMILRDKTINQPSFSNIRIAPSYAQNKNDALALSVLEEILSGGPTTRLYKTLVVEDKKAISVGFSYSGTSLNEGVIGISGVPVKDVSLDELQILVSDEIKKVIENGVEEIELKEAIQRLQDQAIFARDSLAGPAMIIGYSLTTGAALDDIENWPEDIAKVSVKDIQDVAQKYLDDGKPWKRPSITGHYLPLENSKNGEDNETVGKL